MGCGQTQLRTRSKSVELFVTPKAIPDERLRPLFLRTLELKATEESFLSELRNYNYPTFEPVLEKHGHLSLNDFVAFFRFFGQEEHWNVPVSPETLEEEFVKSAENGCWELEQFLTYLKALIGGVLAEVRFELKERNLLLCSFYVLKKKEPELMEQYKKSLTILKENKDTIMKKLFSGADEGGFRKDNSKILDALKNLSYYLPVERVAESYWPLLPGFFLVYDKDKDGRINAAEFVAFLADIIQETQEYLNF
eukprot:TRINITY_DN2106_c0_g1_i1.p9 TRINITY_DN2106_c0_g1~~TRINITY_DN2106_c0_g1_i1.p9  ORF type:complete len:252 (-),score=40.77 TRINITY_DN2106_c0_g1_i1:1131-1886(-)